jgi:hypothetical protein
MKGLKTANLCVCASNIFPYGTSIPKRVPLKRYDYSRSVHGPLKVVSRPPATNKQRIYFPLQRAHGNTVKLDLIKYL